MTRIYDCSVDTEYAAGKRLALSAIGRGALVVIPTDTVYGIAADAFSPEAVQKLLEAKGRDRTSPPPVLIPRITALDALAESVPQPVRDLVAEFWPGGLTVILNAQPSLVWDLGETRGTVALRMPSNPIALDLLAETGPLAVSSANLSGLAAAVNAQSAEDMLGTSVAVYLDGGVAGLAYEPIGERPGDTSSTIIDGTGFDTNGGKISIVRGGVISRAAIAAIIGDALADENAEAVPDAPGSDAPGSDAPGSDLPGSDQGATDRP
jgi:tRNA threonylcarbamoyl adenosine modification protein (Sua5/YciO/YrdC/YwlC family)